MRLNTFDCAIYAHTNLVPEYFEMDDFQVRTPTDIIGQHIHLPKWDLTTTDGAANGWNYEDGTHSPGAIRERIHAINEHNLDLVCNNELPVRSAGQRVERHDADSHGLPRRNVAGRSDGDGSVAGCRRAPVLRPVRPRRLAGRAHDDAALVRRPGGQHRGRRPRPGHHLHARPLRPVDAPADRPVRDRADAAGGFDVEAQRDRNRTGVHDGEQRREADGRRHQYDAVPL